MFEPTILPYEHPISAQVLGLVRDIELQLAWENALREWRDPVIALWLSHNLFAASNTQIQRLA
jgi:hypothetical protein